MKYKDQMGRVVELGSAPRRIVSIVPSQTELLYDLGLENETVGITKFCIYPDRWFRSKQRVGGTKNLNLDAIRALQPDLIIGNKEENTLEDILALEKEFPVWMSDIFTLDDSLEMIRDLGAITEKEKEAKRLVKQIQTNFAQLSKPKKRISVAYFIWKDPYYMAGTQTFIDAMIDACGLENVVKEERYPELIPKHLEEADFLLFSSEPYPFKPEMKAELENAFPNKKVVFVDGEYFSWYGSRLKDAPRYFENLLKELVV